jgi:hypothetical protein
VLEALTDLHPLVFEGTPTFFNSSPVWHDALGFVGAIRSEDGGIRTAIAQMDGQAQMRAYNSPPTLTHNLATKGLAGQTLSGLDVRLYDEVDLRTFRPSGDYLDMSDFFGAVAGSWTILPDRRLFAATGRVYAWALGAEVRTIEATLGLASEHGGDGTISPSRDPEVVFVAYRSGRIYAYNVRTQSVVGETRFIDPAQWICYSPELDVFLGVHRESSIDSVRLWANEVRPHQIAVPAPLDPVQPGRVVGLRTRVQGEQLEPCPGMVVRWQATRGQILEARTMTDAAGYATSRLRLSPAESHPSLDVTAELVL